MLRPRDPRASGVRRQAEVVPLSADSGRAAPSRVRSYQGDALARVARALAANGVPPMDRGLKSIVAQQIRNLLVGGWPYEEIVTTAVALGLKYDRFHGHKAMTQLQATLERGDEQRQEKTHADFKETEPYLAQKAADNLHAQGIDVLGLERVVARREIAAKAFRHPNLHPFQADPNDKSSCRICTGPYGVHRGVA